MMRSRTSKIAVLSAALGVCVIGGSLAVAQTKQLKEPASAQASNSPIQSSITLSPNGSSNSYSVVIENKTTPDGKVVQSRKVWQDGKLVTEEEKTLDANDAQNNFDATIQLPNGQIVGNIISSEEDDDFFSGMSSSPFEAIRQMEERMRAQHESFMKEFDALRQQFADPNNPTNSLILNAPNAITTTRPSASKFWIGAQIESVPELLTYHLPIEEGQGALIQFIVPDSPAAKAGLKKYDVLCKIDGKDVTDPNVVSELIEKIGAAEVEIEYISKGKLEKCKLTIEERPAQNALSLGNARNRNFRVVRPGLIVPSTAADSTLSAESAEADANAEAQNAEEQQAETEEKAEVENK